LRFFIFQTDHYYGNVSNYTEITASAIADNSIEKTAGDDFYLKAGDITLKSYESLTWNISSNNWLVVFNNDLSASYGVFYREKVYSNYNTKTRLYTYKAYSIQKKFYDDFSQSGLIYSTWSDHIFYALRESLVVVSEVNIDGTNQQNRFAFSPGLFINNLASKRTSWGYCINTVTNTHIPAPVANNLPLIMRGQSLPAASATHQEVIEHTFENDDITFMNLLKMAVEPRNCFVLVTGFIVSDQLVINIAIEPRCVDAETSPPTINPIESTRKAAKYKWYGLKVTAGDAEYTQGNIAGKLVLTKSMPIGNMPAEITSDDSTLYYVEGDTRDGTFNGYDRYEIMDASDNNIGYIRAVNIDDYWDPMVDWYSAGNGYEVEYWYNGEQILSQVQIEGETVRILRLYIKDSGRAELEGKVLT